jgi:hypothetical protein
MDDSDAEQQPADGELDNGLVHDGDDQQEVGEHDISSVGSERC